MFETVDNPNGTRTIYYNTGKINIIKPQRRKKNPIDYHPGHGLLTAVSRDRMTNNQSIKAALKIIANMNKNQNMYQKNQGYRTAAISNLVRFLTTSNNQRIRTALKNYTPEIKKESINYFSELPNNQRKQILQTVSEILTLNFNNQTEKRKKALNYLFKMPNTSLTYNQLQACYQVASRGRNAQTRRGTNQKKL